MPDETSGARRVSPNLDRQEQRHATPRQFGDDEAAGVTRCTENNDLMSFRGEGRTCVWHRRNCWKTYFAVCLGPRSNMEFNPAKGKLGSRDVYVPCSTSSRAARCAAASAA